MPLDSTIPQEVGVTARQIGGKSLGDQASWSILFPVDHLRIDGRVPVDKSGLYLTQMRLNPNKELLAVAFSPDAESSIAFDTLSRHLIAKGYVPPRCFMDSVADDLPIFQAAWTYLSMGQSAERSPSRTGALHRSVTTLRPCT